MAAGPIGRQGDPPPLPSRYAAAAAVLAVAGRVTARHGFRRLWVVQTSSHSHRALTRPRKLSSGSPFR